jgi:hypothetical protein
VAPVGSGTEPGHHFVGLIDTGCTRTCITRSVVECFSLPPVTKLLLVSPTETQRRKAYEFQLGFYCDLEDRLGESRTLFMLPEPIIGPDFVDNPNFDVLIGMDVISRGTLTFERNGEFEFVL